MTRKPTPAVLDQIFAVSRETNGVTLRIPLDRIADNPYQYRQHYDPITLRELATNIRSLAFQLPATSGLQQVPCGRIMLPTEGGLSRQLDAGNYEHDHQLRQALATPGAIVQIAYGHRRLRAFQALANGPQAVYPKGDPSLWPATDPDEYGTLPVQLMYLDDQAMAEFALTENSQRDGVSAIEEATLLQRMVNEFGMTPEDAGRRFGWDRSTVSNKLRLLRLPDKVRQWVLQGDITEKHARTLLRLGDAPAVLLTMAEKCKAESWATRKLDEQITNKIRSLHPVPSSPVEMIDAWGSTRTHSTPWELTWRSPTDGVPTACEGCPLRIVFGGELAPRCGDNLCYDAKSKAWDRETERRQREAAETALAALHGGSTLAEVFTDTQRRRIPLLPKTHTYSSPEHVFNLHDERTQLLLEHELCTLDCPCIAAVYEPRDRSGYDRDRKRWQPDAENAPDIVYCCTDKACVEEKLNALRTAADQRRNEQRAAEEAQRRAADAEYAKQAEQRERDRARSEQQDRERMERATAIMDGAVAAAGGLGALWSNHAFMVELVLNVVRYRDRDKTALMTVEQMQAAIVEYTTTQHYANGRIDQDWLTALAKRMAPDVPPAAPAGTADTLPDDLVAHGWELKRTNSGTYRAHVTVDGQDFQTRGNTDLDAVIGDARYMERQLKLAETEVNA